LEQAANRLRDATTAARVSDLRDVFMIFPIQKVRFRDSAVHSQDGLFQPA
jgi:hypothetical protein